MQSARYSRTVVAPPPLEDQAVTEWITRPNRQKQVRLTADQVDELIAAYRAGASWLDLSAQFGIGQTTVWAHLRRREEPKRDRRTALGAEVGRLAASYNTGSSIDTLASVFGMSRAKVRSTLVEAGVEIRRPGRQPSSGRLDHSSSPQIP